MRMYYKIAILIAVVFCGSGCNRNFDKEKDQVSAQVIIDEPKSIQFHVVEKDEDIASIAKKYGMKRSSIVELNDLKPPYKLFVGQKLVVVPSEYSGDSKSGDMKVDSVKPNASTGSTSVVRKETDNILSESSYCAPVADFFGKIVKEYSSLDPFVTVKCRDNDDIFCVADGVVKFVGFLDGDSAQYGKAIIIKHTDLKTISLYCGIDNMSVKVGENVVKGQVIATSGKTGHGATYPQLKYRIDKIINSGTKSVNPRELIRRL